MWLAFMKITISLSNIPLSVTIEGPDESMAKMIDVATQALFKLRETWLGAVECQKKLELEKEKEH
jgi:hypothetical protein